MIKSHLYLFIISLLFLFSCQYNNTELGVIDNYLPSHSYLKNGIVNKFHVHVQQTNNPEISTHLEYQSYQLSNDTLTTNRYKDVHSPITTSISKINDNKFINLTKTYFLRKDTIYSKLVDSIFIDWANKENQYSIINKNDQGTYRLELHQNNNSDTIIMNKPAKVFDFIRTHQSIQGKDTSISISNIQAIYVRDIGLYQWTSTNKKEKIRLELIEQIPLDQFIQDADKPVHQVAYIDPNNTLDDNQSFKLCQTHNRIFDYYNGGHSILTTGGKAARWQFFQENIDTKYLSNESGYLTFRFVVNCEGEAGRFITEEVDLDFQQKKFKAETVQHLYEVIRKIDNWIPLKPIGWQDEYVDAYFYHTFKLQNGVLIDILP